MAQPTGATPLTLFRDGGRVDAAELAELYRYPDDVQKCWVRSNFISSLDGGATADGKSGGLAGPGDRALFTLMRELADVVVVGAGTVRTENYGGAQLSPATRQARQSRGQAEVPTIAIVTASGHLERDMKVFTATEVPPLILTSANAATDTANYLGDRAEVLACSAAAAGAVDLPTVLTALAARGLRRVLTEGGPQLHGSFMAADLLDEICLTIAPTLLGGPARRIATGQQESRAALRRAHLLADDAGYLYARYLRDR